MAGAAAHASFITDIQGWPTTTKTKRKIEKKENKASAHIRANTWDEDAEEKEVTKVGGARREKVSGGGKQHYFLLLFAYRSSAAGDIAASYFVVTVLAGVVRRMTRCEPMQQKWIKLNVWYDPVNVWRFDSSALHGNNNVLKDEFRLFLLHGHKAPHVKEIEDQALSSTPNKENNLKFRRSRAVTSHSDHRQG